MKGIINANNVKIRYSGHFMSLTDMSKARGGDSIVISYWLRNIQTIKFLIAIEKKAENKNFNYGESAIIENKTTQALIQLTLRSFNYLEFQVIKNKVACPNFLIGPFTFYKKHIHLKLVKTNEIVFRKQLLAFA